MPLTVFVHSFGADSSLLDCCDLVVYFSTLCLQVKPTFWVSEVVSAVLFLSFGVICLLAWLGQPYLVCHQHLWFVLSFFATAICGLFYFSLPLAFVVCSFFFATGICGLFFLPLPQAFVVCSFFLCHRHLWSFLSFFVTGICIQFLSFTAAFPAVGILVRLCLCLVSAHSPFVSAPGSDVKDLRHRFARYSRLKQADEI